MCRLAHGEMMVRGKCLFSGLIIQCFFNGLLLIGLGTHDEYVEESEQDYHVSDPSLRRISCLLPRCPVCLHASALSRFLAVPNWQRILEGLHAERCLSITAVSSLKTVRCTPPGRAGSG